MMSVKVQKVLLKHAGEDHMDRPQTLSKSQHQKNTRKQSATWLVILGIIVIAANLRAPLTSVGPLVSLIRDNVHISNTLAGLITTVPLLAFALLSPLVPKLGRKFGTELIIWISLAFLTIGIILRSFSGAFNLYLGTAILGFGIAVCNVLLPSLIKREFPDRIGLMTGVYSISMNLCGAIASGVSVPLAVGSGLQWQGALGIWAVLSFVSFLLWMPQMRNRTKQVSISGYGAQAITHNKVNIWRSPPCLASYPVYGDSIYNFLCSCCMVARNIKTTRH